MSNKLRIYYNVGKIYDDDGVYKIRNRALHVKRKDMEMDSYTVSVSNYIHSSSFVWPIMAVIAY